LSATQTPLVDTVENNVCHIPLSHGVIGSAKVLRAQVEGQGELEVCGVVEARQNGGWLAFRDLTTSWLLLVGALSGLVILGIRPNRHSGRQFLLTDT
jgi:hypothetical protein